jgi:hypothetical protein
MGLHAAPGRSVSKDYKAKFRSLHFNLKDANNPELRARVLRGELAPAVLVTLSSAELANKQLSEWRKKREEEAAKMVFLDTETAAKFSTAAAAALAQSRMRKDDEGAAAKPAAEPDRATKPQLAEEADPAAASAAPAADAEGGVAAAMSAAADAALQRSNSRTEQSSARGPRGLARTHSQGTGTSGGGAAPSDGLARRTSVTSLPLSGAGAEEQAAAGAPSSGSPKRAVLRASLPAAPPGDETPPRANAVGGYRGAVPLQATALPPGGLGSVGTPYPRAPPRAAPPSPSGPQGEDVPYDPDSYDDPYEPQRGAEAGLEAGAAPDAADGPKHTGGAAVLLGHSARRVWPAAQCVRSGLQPPDTAPPWSQTCAPLGPRSAVRGVAARGALGEPAAHGQRGAGRVAQLAAGLARRGARARLGAGRPGAAGAARRAAARGRGPGGAPGCEGGWGRAAAGPRGNPAGCCAWCGLRGGTQ